MPGPPKTPTAQLAPSGNRRKEREKTEPKPAAGEPEMPDDLTEAARPVWRAMVKLFATLMPGVLSSVDGRGLARYCEDYVDWRRCVDFVREYGEGVLRQKKMIKKGKGDEPDQEIVTSEYFLYFPAATFRLRYGEALERWEKQFGLTAASRPNVQVPMSGTHVADDATQRFFKTVG